MQDPQNYAIIDGRIPPPSPGNPGGVGFTGYFRTQDGSYGGVPLTNYQIAQNYTPRRRQDNDAVELTGEWTVSPTNKVTSITSWDEGKLFNPEGTDGSPYDIWKIPYIGDTRQVTQDLRLTSTGDSPLRYIVGAYYQHEIVFNSTENEIFTDPAFNTYNDYRDCAASSFGPGAGYNVGSNINLGCDYFNSFDQILKRWINCAAAIRCPLQIWDSSVRSRTAPWVRRWCCRARRITASWSIRPAISFFTIRRPPAVWGRTSR
jgi:hypothetical protein